MKLSRRGKRTKCAKRTKRFKLKRNTKKQFRQYKRKNTHRKHSRKLRKNKRVMRGGVENLNLAVQLDSLSNSELEYTTSDRFSKFKNFFGSLQKGNFTVSLQLDEGYTISETGQDNKTMKGTLDYAVEIVNYPSNSTQLVKCDFIPKTPDIYNFTLIMKKDGKDFQVKFVIKVKKYKFRLFKIKNSGESYGIDFDLGTGYPRLVLGSKSGSTDDDDDDGITYSSGDNPTTFNNYEIMKDNPQPFTIVQHGTEKKYTFPMKYAYGNITNNSFFSIIRNKMIEKILEKYKEKLLAVLAQPQPQQPQQQQPTESV